LAATIWYALGRGIPSLVSPLASSAMTLSRADSMAAITSSIAVRAFGPLASASAAGASVGRTSLGALVFPSLLSFAIPFFTILDESSGEIGRASCREGGLNSMIAVLMGKRSADSV